MKIGFGTAWMACLMAMPALGTDRNWTGSAGANWLNNNNWNPYGYPHDGDTLIFGAVADSNRSMVNDITNLTVSQLNFGNNDYQLDGNALTVTKEIYSGYYNSSATTTINCALVFPGGGLIDTGGVGGSFTETTEYLHMNGAIAVDGGELRLSARSVAADSGFSGGDGHLYVSGVVSGGGTVLAYAEEADGYVSTVEFNGTQGNTFRGLLYLATLGNTQIMFNKSSGFVATNGVAVTGGNSANLNINGPDQIPNSSTISITAGSQLLLSGNNVTVNNLTLNNVSADATASILDTGSVLVGLNGGITSSVDNDHVHPTIKGTINLNGFLPFNVSGGSEPGLEILATIEGNGFQKLGGGTLRLSGNNTFFGDAEISAGTVEVYTATAFGQAGPTYGVELDGGNLVLQGVAIGAEPLFVNSAVSFLTAFNQCSWAGPVTLNTDLNVVPVDVTDSGLEMNFSGPISGSGGLNLQPALFAVGNVQLSGPAGNTFTGPTTVNCQLLELNKPSGVNAYAGPLIVGGAAGSALHEARWLNSYQNVYATLTLYANGYVNLTNHNEDFGAVTFNGGTVDSGPSGQFGIYQPLTVNPSSTSAVINGVLGLPSGGSPPTRPAVFIVGDGPADCDLIVNAYAFGSPTYFVKQGPGTMCLTGGNTFDAITLLEEGILDINDGSVLGTQPGLVIFGGATLRLDGSGSMSEGFEVVGAGVGGVHGAVEVTPGSAFTVNGGILLDAATTFNIPQSASLTLNGSINGTGPLTETGGGPLTLGGLSPNTYSGDTIVSAGLLYLAKSSGSPIAVPGNLVLGPAPSDASALAIFLSPNSIGGTMVTVNANSALNLNGRDQTLSQLNLNDGGGVQTGTGHLILANGSVNVASLSGLGSHASSTISGYITVPGGVRGGYAIFNVATNAPTPPLLLTPELEVPAIISGGTLNRGNVLYKAGLGQMQLTGNNTFLHVVEVDEGTLIAGSAGALGSASAATTVKNGATLALDGGVTISGEALLLDSTNVPALDSRSGANTWTGPITLSRGSSINVNSSLQCSGVISGSGNLIKVGSGNLIFAGAANNTYAGDTFVNAGTLVLQTPAGVTAIPQNVVIGTGPGGAAATLLQQSSFSIIGQVTVNGGGLWDLSGQAEGFSSISPPPLTLNDGGSVQTGSGIIYLPVGGDVVVNPGASSSSINGNIGLDAGLHHFTVGSGGSDPGLTVYAAIGQTGSAAAIQKDGPGLLRLSGANTYTGTRVVTAGTLEVDGSQAQSPIQINGGTLKGIGTVGSVSFTGASGIIAPGDSPGVLTSGNLGLGSGSGTLQVELNGTTPGSDYDQLNVQGTVNLSGISLSASLNFASAVSNQFTIINNDGTDAVVGTFTGLPEGATLYIGGEQFQITYTGGDGNDVVLTRLVTPARPVLTIQSLPPASVLLLWPTNDPPFSLQVNTNLTTTNWGKASPLPVVVGTNNMVTNAISGPASFYRLSKP
jgi:autotransporter-associated beta strand protein